MAELVELGQDESWELVRGRALCRVAWTSATGPVIIPVNFVVHDKSLWIRTSAYSSLVREVDDMSVAILVDEIDDETRLGWSVQLRGTAQIHWHLEEVPEEVRTLHTWASGSRPLWIQLVPQELNGRRLVSGD